MAMHNFGDWAAAPIGLFLFWLRLPWPADAGDTLPVTTLPVTLCAVRIDAKKCQKRSKAPA